MGKKSPGSIAGKEDAGKKEDDANGEGDEGLLGLQPPRCRLDHKGGDGLDHAHGGVQPEGPQHEEEKGAPQLGQREGAHLRKVQSVMFLQKVLKVESLQELDKMLCLRKADYWGLQSSQG